ncbi:unnamed protein product [Caenorhabditis bovis]|uniref:Uncharacterized protein n=1 Tax=Caenorhabditis bovis TaxID=2654633 RepID=A0A8S1F249_9PELO|nr:unnamed protein product [Caenorhabditis bovis]
MHLFATITVSALLAAYFANAATTAKSDTELLEQTKKACEKSYDELVKLNKECHATCKTNSVSNIFGNNHQLTDFEKNRQGLPSCY